MIGRKPRMPELQKELNRIMDRIDKTNIKKIILFGSLAKGRVTLTSDIDLVIIRNTKQRFLNRLGAIYKQIKPNIAVDILVYTPQEINKMKHWNSFIKRVFREGKVLYEA